MAIELDVDKLKSAITEQQQEEIDLLTKNFQLIYDHAELIVNTPEYFYCQLEVARLGLMHIGGGCLPLGVLLLLWKEGEFIDKCTSCGHDVYICEACGSPLSGSFIWWGVCPKCESRIDFTGYGFEWKAAFDKMKKYKNEAIIEKGQKPIFSLSKGVVGEYTPDRIIKPKISGISLKDLVRVLKEEG